MARKIDNQLKKELLKGGKYSKILSCVKNDNELTLEIRKNSEVKIYFQKSLILTLSTNKFTELDPGFYKKEGLDKPILDLNEPKKYFGRAKRLVLFTKGDNGEFQIQQNIARYNRSISNKYFVVDLEYQVPQEKRPKEKRLPKTRIDIVAIEKFSNDIILFELKFGLRATENNSGVDAHYEKTMNIIQDNEFCDIIREDVRNILIDKKDLGLISYETIPTFGNIKMKYILAYDNEEEMLKYKNEYEKKYNEKGVETIFIDTRYILE